MYFHIFCYLGSFTTLVVKCHQIPFRTERHICLYVAMSVRYTVCLCHVCSGDQLCSLPPLEPHVTTKAPKHHHQFQNSHTPLPTPTSPHLTCLIPSLCLSPSCTHSTLTLVMYKQIITGD